MAAPGQHRTGFFDLPWEIRRCIYQLVFPHTTFITPTSHVERFGIGYTYPARSLRISRFFAQEAGPIFWSSGTFRFSSLDIAVQFIHLIGPNNSSMIHRIQIATATIGANMTLGDRTVEATNHRSTLGTELAIITDFIVRPCTSLRRLIIDYVGLHAGNHEAQLQMFRDLQQWQTALAMRGLTRLDFGQGLNAICVMAAGETRPITDSSLNIYYPDFGPLDIGEKIEGLVDIIETNKAAAKARATAARQARQARRRAEQQQQAADDAAARAQEQARARAQARAVALAEARGRAQQDAVWRDHLAAQRVQEERVSEDSYDYDDPDMMLRLFDEFS